MAKLIVLFACVALAAATPMTRREAPANNPFQDLQKNAEEVGKTMTEQWNAIVNSKNSQEVQKAIKDNSDDVLKHISSFSESLQGVIADANGKAKESLTKTKENFEKMVADLRKEHPEVEKQAAETGQKIQAAFQSAMAESQKLAQSVGTNADEAAKKLAPQLQSAYDNMVKGLQTVQKNIHDAATKQ